MNYLTAIGFERIARFEQELLEYATGALSRLPGVRVLGTAADKAGVLSFVLDGVHPHDVGTILDREGVAIRAGHHCCQPLMDRLGRAGDGPGVAGAVQQPRRHRRAVGGAADRPRAIPMTSDLQLLYRDVIVDHSRHPRNVRTLAAGRKAEGFNPLCGDRLTVYVQIDAGSSGT